MFDSLFAVLAAAVFLFFAFLSFALLIRPRFFFRMFPNPLQTDTPWNHVQMRGVGLVFCLMLLMMLSGVLRGAHGPALLEGFHHNILIALWVSVFAAPIISWILWRFSVDFLVRRGHIDPTMEDPAWERGMTLTFCSLLSVIVLISLFLAARGHHPQFKRSSGRSLVSVRAMRHVDVRESAQSMTPASWRVCATVAAISGAPGVSP